MIFLCFQVLNQNLRHLKCSQFYDETVKNVSFTVNCVTLSVLLCFCDIHQVWLYQRAAKKRPKKPMQYEITISNCLLPEIKTNLHDFREEIFTKQQWERRFVKTKTKFVTFKMKLKINVAFCLSTFHRPLFIDQLARGQLSP